MFAESCFVKWYTKHRGIVFREALRICKVHSEGSTHIGRDFAHDLSAQVWVKVWGRKDVQGELIEYPKAWLKTVANHHCQDYFDRFEHRESITGCHEINPATEKLNSAWSENIDALLDAKSQITASRKGFTRK